MSETYHSLMAGAGAGEDFDRHVFACLLAKAVGEAPRPLTQALGLPRAELARLLAACFPAAQELLDGQPEESGADAVEEPDLRRLLLDNATRPGSDEARWLAAMVARRSLEPDHLWQDMGLAARADLTGLLRRHFAPLAEKNDRDMKWKKFLYRQMCEAEGVSICRAPVCEQCADFAQCFAPEA